MGVLQTWYLAYWWVSNCFFHELSYVCHYFFCPLSYRQRFVWYPGYHGYQFCGPLLSALDCTVIIMSNPTTALMLCCGGVVLSLGFVTIALTYGSSARGGWCPLKIAGVFPKIVSVLALRVTSIFIGFTNRFFLLLTDSLCADPM